MLAIISARYEGAAELPAPRPTQADVAGDLKCHPALLECLGRRFW
jgi:hypothetical protein